MSDNPYVDQIDPLMDPETKLTPEQDARVEKLVEKITEYMNSPKGEKIKKLAAHPGRFNGLKIVKSYMEMYTFIVDMAKKEKYTSTELRVAFDLWKLRNGS